MSQPNPIVNRLQQQKSRIAGMLSPGATRSRQKHEDWHFSPVAPDFGGRKFHQVAQRMRVLDRDHLGPSCSGRVVEMANTIQAKFKNSRSMLHLSLPGKSEKSFWSEVEQVFPSQVSGHFDAPLASGEFRRGSVIPKFETFPQPGQSLESFKEQAQDTPTVRKPEEAYPPKKPILSPKDRRFTRVQELPTSQNEKKSEGRPKAEPPVERSSPPGGTVQRQPKQDLRPEPTIAQGPETSENIKPEVELARPTSKLDIDRPSLPVALPVKKTSQPASSTISSPEATPNHPTTRPLGHPTTRPPDQPTARPPDHPNIQRQLATAKPAQKAKVSPAVRPSETRTDIQPAKTLSDVQPFETGPNIQTPETQAEIRPDILSSDKTSEPAVKTSPPQEHLSRKREQTENTPEMPLKGHLERKRNVIESLPSGKTSRALPVASPKLPGAKASLIQRKVHLPAEDERGLATPTHVEPTVSQREPSKLSLAWKSAKSAWHAASKVAENVISPLTDPIGTAQTYLHNDTVEKALGFVTDPIGSTETYVEGQLAKMFEDEEPARPAKPKKSQVSLGQLAEQVLPLVKHLLEIESERTGRQFQ